MEPDYINFFKSGIKLVHADTVQAQAYARNKPIQDVVREVGADAGIKVFRAVPMDFHTDQNKK